MCMVSTEPAGAENTWCKRLSNKKKYKHTNKKEKFQIFFFLIKKEVQTSLPCDYCLFQKTRSLHSFNDSKHVVFKNP